MMNRGIPSAEAPPRQGTSAWWWRLWILALVGLSLICLRATETYAREFETFPFVEWVEAHPPLDGSAHVPPAERLARAVEGGLEPGAVLVSSGSFDPSFKAPGFFQRSIAGVRDSAEVAYAVRGGAQLEMPSEQIQLDVAVFRRELRARAWVDLFTTEYDTAPGRIRPDMLRVTAVDHDRAMWVANPAQLSPSTGEAVVTGWRGPVAYTLQVVVRPPSGRSAAKVDQAALAQNRAAVIVQRWLDAW